MRVALSTIVAFLGYAVVSTAQGHFSKTNVYADFGLYMKGSPASLNVEFRLHGSRTFNLYGRFGAALAADGDLFGGTDLAYGGIGALTLMTGSKNHHFIADAGVFLGMLEYNIYGEGYFWRFYPFPVLNVGYRYQKPKGGFLFNTKLGFAGLGIGLGYAF